MTIGQTDQAVRPTKEQDIETDTSLTAVYLTQYHLVLNSQVNATGGWYDQDSTAQVSIPQSVPIAGGLGGIQFFQGGCENGNLVIAPSGTSIIMTGPHTLSAKFSTDYNMPALIGGVVALIIAGSLILVRRRIKKSKDGAARNR